MTAALTMAALMVRAGTDNPAALDVPAAQQERAAALMGRLGGRQFAERDAATRELEAMGRLALPAVQAGRRSADAEVRLRCERLLPAMETEELAARLAVFVADAAGRYEHRVPGWELFRAAAGDDRVARDLFAEITKERANWPLLSALRGPGTDVRGGLLAAAGGAGAWADRPTPARAAQAGAVRRWEFYAAREAPPAVGADDDAPPARRPEPSVPEVALVILAETLHSEKLAVKAGPVDFVNSFFGTKPGRDAMTGQGRFGPAFARLCLVWMDTRDGDGVQQAYARSKHINLDPAVQLRYAARVFARRSAAADTRSECLGRLVKDPPPAALGLVMAQLDDTASGIQDSVLAAAVLLSGQSLEDYGMVESQPTGAFAVSGTIDRKELPKAIAAARAAGYARWRDWEATRFGAVAGPAVIAGARPVP